MAAAVLFDWRETLVHFEWDERLLAAGHRAGLAAAGAQFDPAEFTRRFRDELLPALRPRGDYAALLQAELGLDRAQADAFLLAEQTVWEPAVALVGGAHALLEAVGRLGYVIGVVADHWPEPAPLARREIARLGVAERVDAIVLSGEVGAEKPDRRIFAEALERVGAAPEECVFVGDDPVADVRGAGELGMATVQALWFEADPAPAGIEPDFLAFTPADVLDALRLLRPLAP